MSGALEHLHQQRKATACGGFLYGLLLRKSKRTALVQKGLIPKPAGF
ncbi:MULTISPECIES: hypothetical protein [Comamonas]|nr:MULTISPECIES: hypothetical protein [Comamonas]UUC94112.1 hypothetical protein NOX35_01755 [Comamonas sp. C11]WEE78158.1 hypothetical protein LZ683_01700 [Comamonas testosteroni]